MSACHGLIRSMSPAACCKGTSAKVCERFGPRMARAWKPKCRRAFAGASRVPCAGKAGHLAMQGNAASAGANAFMTHEWVHDKLRYCPTVCPLSGNAVFVGCIPLSGPAVPGGHHPTVPRGSRSVQAFPRPWSIPAHLHTCTPAHPHTRTPAHPHIRTSAQGGRSGVLPLAPGAFAGTARGPRGISGTRGPCFRVGPRAGPMRGGWRGGFLSGPLPGLLWAGRRGKAWRARLPGLAWSAGALGLAQCRAARCWAGSGAGGSGARRALGCQAATRQARASPARRGFRLASPKGSCSGNVQLWRRRVMVPLLRGKP